MSASLEDVQDGILDRIHAGETVDREALLTEHPEHAEALKAFFEVLQIVEGAAVEGGPAPATLGEFRIIQEIGRGGMGVVYEAEQASLKRRVALKVLPPTLRMDARLVSRFRREAEAAGRLRHPGIVPVFSVGEAAGAPFFAMELVEGTSLQQILTARRAGEELDLPSEPDAWRRWAVETVAHIADALAYAHGEGILHRDVKPGNILLDASGAPRLTDFGLALDLRAPGLSQTGEVFGSPQYMSPEQAIRREAPVDERTDVYSLAVTLYELLTLRLPYEGTTSAQLITALAAGQVVPPRHADPGMPRPLEQVLLRAMRKEPRDRHSGAAEFASDLRAALEAKDTGGVGRTLRRLAAIWLVGLACITAAVWWGWQRDDVSTPAPTPPAERIDEDAERRALGYLEFAHEVSEDIAFRNYPYVKAVEAATAKRWFAPDEKEAYALALKAWKETQAHYNKLVQDHRFRAADEMRANLKMDRFLGDYNYATRWADPYLICYASKDRLSEYDLLSVEDPDERRLKLKELAAKRRLYERVLDEKAALFQQLYREYMRRYAKSLHLKDLMSEYGGRPDLPVGVRSYANGVPLVVWIFESKAAFAEYHRHVIKRPSLGGTAGYFSPQTTYLLLYDESDDPDDRAYEISRNLHEGVHQLQFWFTRQKNNWRKPLPGQGWCQCGFADYLSSVQMEPDGTLKFIGVNAPRLRSMQALAGALEKQGSAYRIFPLAQLTAFGSFGEVQQWGAREWQLAPEMVLGTYYQQSWALAHFLNHAEAGLYRESFEKFYGLVLQRMTGYGRGSQAFEEAFRILGADDWAELDAAFQAYVRDHLMKLKPAAFEYTPPARGTLGRK